MTKFFDLTKAMFQEKFRLANQVLGFSALAAVVVTLYEMIRISAALAHSSPPLNPFWD